jgi:hypothetical protein
MINLSAMDMGLSIGFLALFTLFGSLDYSSIFSLAPFLNETSITVIGLFLLIGAMAKSAQIPLHSWLPGSMEGSIKFSNLIFNTSKLFIQDITKLNLIISTINQLSYSIIYLSYRLYSTKIERDSKGRFKLINNPFVPLPDIINEALIGELLGDGHLRGTHKDETGNIKGNCHFGITLKSYDYAYYLWRDIYSPICTDTPIRSWPNPKTGKIPSQYAFSSKSLVSLTKIHKE